MHTVLVLGGYGFFGRRICTSLAKDPVRLLIAGRDAARAQQLADSLGLPAGSGVRVDADNPFLAQELTRLGVNTLIHTAGPFQGQDYRVAQAAILAGCNYIDLADGRGFVASIGMLNAAARARGVSVVSGASSVPALSSAVVDRFLPRFEELQAIRVGISSGARVPGVATVRGIFSYAGKAFPGWEDGEARTAYGWLELRRYKFRRPLGSRFMSRCNVPDLQLFPKRYPRVRSVSFHAGFASGLGHLLVWTLAKCVQKGVLRSALPFAAPLHRMSQVLSPFISRRGGMFVQMSGIGVDGAPETATWHLLAAKNHGPYIPCGAAIALVRKLIADPQALPAGAMPCMGLLTVYEYLAPLQGLAIREVFD